MTQAVAPRVFATDDELRSFLVNLRRRIIVIGFSMVAVTPLVWLAYGWLSVVFLGVTMVVSLGALVRRYLVIARGARDVGVTRR